MRGWLALGVVLVLSISGCAQKSSSSSSVSATGTPAAGAAGANATTMAGASNGTMAGGPNHAPTGAITANQTAGKAPLKVTFTLNATDADGDKVSYTVDFDGNGTVDAKQANATFPAHVNHTYANAGVYNVTYTVTDGKNSTAYKAKVNVTGGSSGPAITVTGSAKTPCTWCYFTSDTTSCVGFEAGVNSADCFWGALTPAAAGRPFHLTAGDDPGLEFFDKCSASGKSLGFQDVTADDEVGVIPAGAGCVVMYAFSAPQTAFTLVIS